MANCEAVVKRKLEEISDVQQSLMSKEENLEDEINDIFANITALLEGRRKEEFDGTQKVGFWRGQQTNKKARNTK